ncbi:MAG: 50S ribosomal protein L7/L12 [Dehalococcoidia bacterium]|nr:50S ribosomal protein L7/L12 [Dehalococcoidia bacterium]
MTKDEVLEAIKQMSVLDLAELVKSLESEFGITAAAPVAVAPVAAAAGGAAAPEAAAAPDEEQFEFSVVLQDIGTNKINVIKAVREVTTLGLREAKELVESAPARVKEAVPREEADKVKTALEAAGATVNVE